MIKKFIKNITGIAKREELQKIEQARTEEQERIKLEKLEKQRAARQAKKEKAAEALLSPKDIANKRKEPWVDVIGFKVNQDNIRNGFYELDWNEYFIVELKKEGYGYDGDPDEEIVGRWFKDICINAAIEEGVDMTDRNAGYINVTKLTGGKAEVK